MHFLSVFSFQLFFSQKAFCLIVFVVLPTYVVWREADGADLGGRRKYSHESLEDRKTEKETCEAKRDNNTKNKDNEDNDTSPFPPPVHFSFVPPRETTSGGPRHGCPSRHGRRIAAKRVTTACCLAA